MKHRVVGFRRRKVWHAVKLNFELRRTLGARSSRDPEGSYEAILADVKKLEFSEVEPEYCQ